MNLWKAFSISERCQSVSDASTWEYYTGMKIVEWESLAIDCWQNGKRIDMLYNTYIDIIFMLTIIFIIYMLSNYKFIQYVQAYLNLVLQL